VAESLPKATSAGHWTALGAICNGARQAGGTRITVKLSAGAGARCLFSNRFVPAGRLKLRKATLGGTRTVSFLISAVREPDRTYKQTATTTKTATPVLAKGDDTSSLPLGEYDITESSAAAKDGRWALAYVLCNGKPLAAEQGRIRVVLSSRQPRAEHDSD